MVFWPTLNRCDTAIKRRICPDFKSFILISFIQKKITAIKEGALSVNWN